ncbi:hypothetical protein H4R21_005712, partial [Coemansia helicoidea]
PVLVDQAAGAALDAPPDLPRLALPPSIASRSIGGESGLAHSVVVDHVVTHVCYADDQVSAAEQKPAPLRRLTVKWARRLQGKEPAETPPPRPPPLPQRAQTLAELPWDIVAVPRRRSRTGSVVLTPATQYAASNPALALRDDGLPAQQWYVPQAPAVAAEDEEEEEEVR